MNQSDLIHKIKESKSRCYFISPHLDDAIFSAGNLLLELKKNDIECEVINVFTNISEKPYTLSAKQFVKQCGYANAEELFADRRSEDLEIFNSIGIKTVDLGLQDSLFRKNTSNSVLNFIGKIVAEFNTVYPTYRLHISKGRIAKRDSSAIETIKTKLISLIPEDSFVFCPIGIGNHVDHIIVRDVCSESFKSVIYWEDYPYVLEHEVDKSYVTRNNLIEIKSNKENTNKLNLIAKYKTQYNAIFGNKRPNIVAEIYYTTEGTKE